MDFDLDDAEVHEMIVEGETFFEAAKDYLERKDNEDTIGRA